MTVTITTQGNPVNIASDHQTIAVNMTNYDNSAAAVAAAASASASAASAALYDGPWRDTVALLIADTSLTYTPALPGTVVAGDYVRTRKEGFAYQVAASGAAFGPTGYQVITAGGVKLIVLQSAGGPFDRLAFGPLDSASSAAAFAKRAASTHVLQLPIGTYPTSAQASLSGYFNISGYGDESLVTVPAATIGLAYTSQVGVFDDHPHNMTRDFRIRGNGTFVAAPGSQNGTSTGLSFAMVPDIGSLGCAQGMTFEMHAVGRHVKQSYGHVGFRNHYRANKVGLLLENVTSFTEMNIYARHNSDAAVRIIGGQNVTLQGGAIEGNIGKALDVVLDVTRLYGQLNLNDVYFESNGNQAASNGWSIDVPYNTNTMVSINGGNYWLNVISGITSGPYRLGPSLSMSGATIGGNFYAKEVTRFDNCRGTGPGVWNTMPTEALARQFGLVEPAIFHHFAPAAREVPFDSTATAGLIIATKLQGRSNMLVPDAPNLGSYTYPFGMSASGGAVASVNSALDYGDGSWLKCTYAASIGTFNTNYLTMTSFADTTKQFRTFVCLVRAESACEIGFMQSVGGQATTGYYALEANKTYRMIFCGFAPMSAASYLRMFPLNAAGPVVNVLPMWQSQHSTYLDQLKVLEMLVSGPAGGQITLRGSAVYDPPSLADGAGDTTTVTVTGASLGDFAEASFGVNLSGITLTAWVSAANTVSVRFQNESGGILDLASSTLKVQVRK